MEPRPKTTCYAMVVCLSILLSQVSILSKRLNTTHKQRHTIAILVLWRIRFCGNSSEVTPNCRGDKYRCTYFKLFKMRRFFVQLRSS